jgi:hypothetical protein
MTRPSEKIRYLSWNFIQDVIGFIFNYFFPFCEHGQDHIVEIHVDQIQPEEPQEIKPSFTDPVHTPTLVNIPDRYKPLILPPILHDFPANYYKHLPRFDGEHGNITAEKHIQGFENFLDLFEVEEVDACIRIFTLSLQGRAKEWFKTLSVASIPNLQQFVEVFLGKWEIKRNPFLILEEYDHLKRHPGETVQHFSSRFNRVYNSMPADIRPPPGSTLLRYPDSFDPEMAFQLRERNTTTLKEMQDSAISVEANLLIKRSKLEAEDRKNKEKEQLKSSEAKLDILAKTMEEMLHRISIREKLDVQRHHVPLISEKERVIVPKHVAAQPWYQGLENDHFMYSIHDTVKDETPSQFAEGQPADMMCMFDDISFLDNLPKYDQYDDDYVAEIGVDCSKQSTTCCWEEEDQLQLKYDNQPVHIDYDSKEENAANLRVSERSMPLMFLFISNF